MLGPAGVVDVGCPNGAFQVPNEGERRAYGDDRTRTQVLDASDRLAAGPSQKTSRC